MAEAVSLLFFLAGYGKDEERFDLPLLVTFKEIPPAIVVEWCKRRRE